MLILIPAYQPGGALPELLDALRVTLPGVRVLVVDDGSGPEYDALFAAAAARGALLQRHARNRGKGAALKSGFALIEREHPGHDVLTADCDGQHRPEDIAAVARQLRQCPRLTLGERRFTGPVPLRSRLGNRATTLFFALSTGLWLPDTQTGLRGIPAALLPWLARVPGERYDYELNMLLRARREGLELGSVPIAAVYLDGNRSSHFRPVRDSARIYAPLLKFAGASLAGFALDTVLLLGFTALSVGLPVAVLLARVGSAALNFLLNRRLVFDSGRERPLVGAALRYLALAAVLLAANYQLLVLLTGWGMPLLAAKLATEAGLFLASYAVQHRWLFARRRTALQGGRPGDSYARLVRPTEPAQPRGEE